MEITVRFICSVVSFIIPFVGISLYFAYKNKHDAKLFGMISIIGIFVYIGIGIGFI